MAPNNIGVNGQKHSNPYCQDKKQKSTEILGKVVKPQQRTTLINGAY